MRPLLGGRIFLAANWIAQERIGMPIHIPSSETRPDYYSMKEFAALFGRERRWTKRLIDIGAIVGVKMAGTNRQTWIPSDQIERVTGATGKVPQSQSEYYADNFRIGRKVSPQDRAPSPEAL